MHSKLSSAKMVAILSWERWVDYNLLMIFFHWKYCAGWNHFGSLLVNRALFYWQFSHCNSNLMEISFHSHLDSDTVITKKFCTRHDSCAVVACAKIVAIWWTPMELQQGEISIVFESLAKLVSETGPRHAYHVTNVVITFEITCLWH